MTFLDASKVTKNFGGLVAVGSVDFVMERGMIAGLIGPNGAGKTTFFNMITGVYPMSSGEITFDGVSLVGRSRSRSPRWALRARSRTSACSPT